LDGAIAGWAVDVDRDGRDELAVVGEGVVKLVRFGEPTRVEDLMALVPEDDLRRRCLGGSALPYDVDLDGWLDLIVACQGTDVTERDNLTFKLMPGGASAALMPRDPWDQLQDKGIDLALGAVDVDRDGLVDLIVANDAFSTRFEDAFGDFPAGGVFRRCAPDEGCVATRWPFGEGTAESGSYMGVGNVEVDGQGEMIYLADWGPNRLLLYTPEGAVMDLAPDLGVELASDPGTGELLFAWGVVVEDFDRNGLDDLLVSQGRVYAIDDPDAPLDVAAFAANRDVILFQTEGGLFRALGQEVGLGPQTLEDSGDAQRPYASRGAVKVDFDADGRLEILIAGMEGRFKLYTEAAPLPGEPARCTLAPSPLLVPAVGYGYEVAPTPQGPWKRSDVQGQLRLGASPWPTTNLRAGFLRFPSGATVPFDCAGGVGPVAVAEPPWLDWTLGQDGGLSVLVERPGGAPAQVEAALDLQGDGQAQVVALEAEGGDRWRLPAPLPRRFMLRLDGRWLPRWFVP
jgi:hypothetical protein